MPVLYDAAIGLYHAGVRLAAAWDPKARAWTEGRAGLWERLERKAPALRGCLWMHCASVGEFEQGRPVLEAIKARHPDLPVLLTFFSPSGYQARKDEPLATHVDFLPPDGAANARRLLDLVAPRAAVFVKYEFWYHHLAALRERRVPTFLIAALFRKGQPFFQWYGGAWRRMLACFTRILTQDEASLALLRKLGIGHAAVGGDTRFDRVADIVAAAPPLPIAEAFSGNEPTLVLGSTWPADEAVLLAALQGLSVKCIIAPHELREAQLRAIEERFPAPLVQWSELEAADPANVRAMLGQGPQGTLLVDRMGLLARLYQHGRIAYVGGGFSDGIHSVLEAAAWGRPVLFGPRHRKFPEAQGLIDAGAAMAVHDGPGLRKALDHWLGDPAALERASLAARRFVDERRAATGRVMQELLPHLGKLP